MRAWGKSECMTDITHPLDRAYFRPLKAVLTHSLDRLWCDTARPVRRCELSTQVGAELHTANVQQHIIAGFEATGPYPIDRSRAQPHIATLPAVRAPDRHLERAEAIVAGDFNEVGTAGETTGTSHDPLVLPHILRLGPTVITRPEHTYHGPNDHSALLDWVLIAAPATLSRLTNPTTAAAARRVSAAAIVTSTPIVAMAAATVADHQ